MLSFWLPGLEPAWRMALFAVGFAAMGTIAYFAVRSRAEREPDAATVAVLYATGYGILAVSELVILAEAAWGWSAAALLGISGGAVTVVAVIVTAVALAFIVIATAVEVREQQVYLMRHAHGGMR